MKVPLHTLHSEHTRVKTSQPRLINHSTAGSHQLEHVICDLEIGEVSLVPRIIRRSKYSKANKQGCKSKLPVFHHLLAATKPTVNVLTRKSMFYRLYHCTGTFPLMSAIIRQQEKCQECLN